MRFQGSVSCAAKGTYKYNKMKTHLTYIGLIVAIAVIAFLFYDRWRNAEDTSNKYAQVITEQQAEIEYRKTQNGRLLASKTAAELTTQQLVKAYPDIVKQITDEFDVKLNNVKAFMKNEFEAHGSGNSTIVHNHYDSAGAQVSTKVMVDDGYLSFRATIYDSLNAPYEYVYRDTVSTVISTKRKWIFGKETLTASTQFSNPSSKSVSMTNLIMNNYRDKRWNISAGISWLPISKVDKPIERFQPTISIGRTLFKF